MANIMINEKCNLKCPYCFASEFTLDRTTKNMSIEDFKHAVNFALSSGPSRIGIIGGEPTLHPQFKEIMEILINDDRVDRVVLFTNAFSIDRYFKLLTHEKIGILVNYNSPNDIGEDNFKRVKENIRIMHEDYYMGNKITLGINMYKPGFDYEYLLEDLVRYKKRELRASISMPKNIREIDPIDHMESMKESVFEFFRELEKIQVYPRYDCNYMPPCITTESEKIWLQKLNDMVGDTVLLNSPNCCPVIDITVDMTAIRCFALSKETKADIRKFNNIGELERFYETQIDSFKTITYASERCKTCDLAHKGICTGGCLGYKIEKILALRELVSAKQMGGKI